MPGPTPLFDIEALPRGYKRPICAPPGFTHASECHVCNAQYLTLETQKTGTNNTDKVQYFAEWTDDHAEVEVLDVLAEIDHDFHQLQQHLSRVGDVVMSRWMKKSKAWRMSILDLTDLTFQTNLFHEVPSSKADPMDFTTRTSVRNWPSAFWLCFDDLAEHRTQMLSLLYNRSTFSPSHFAMLDIQQLCYSFGLDDRVAELYFNAKCLKLTREGYGSLVDWQEDLAHSWAIAGFPRAYMMLQTQHSILRFLLQITQNICEDSDGTGDQKWKAFIAGGAKPPGSSTMWSTYIDPALAPPVSDWHFHISSIARSRHDAIHDGIWLMQTDAAYMHSIVRARKASVVYGGSSKVPIETQWQKIAGDFVLEQHRRLLTWWKIAEAALKLREVAQSTTGSASRDLHTLAALKILDEEVWTGSRLLSYTLDLLAPRMGALRSKYMPYMQNGVIKHTPDFTKNWNPKNTDDVFMLLYHSIQLFFQLNVHPEEVQRRFAMLHDVLENPKTNTKCMDDRLMDCLSDIAAFAEMRNMLAHNQIGYRSKAITNTPKGAGKNHAVVAVELNIPEDSIQRLGKAMQAFHDTPWPKGRQDGIWLSKASASRAKLAEFWQVYREELQNLKQSPQDHKLTEELLTRIDFDTRPEHLAELEEERKALSKTSAVPTAGSESPQVDNNEAAFDHGSVDAGLVKRKTTKAKAQRLQSSSMDTTAGTQHNNSLTDTEEAATVPLSSIPVKQDTLIVTSKMFPAVGTSGGSVRWPQFVQAMADAGLNATAEGGSAVSFTNGTASISVHRPHPDPVINPIMLKAIGKRLGKAMKWSGERFVLRPRE